MRRYHISVLLILLVTLGLAACGSLTEAQCRQNRWYEVGYNDGIEGASPTLLARHHKTCADYGITPNAILWSQGRQEGLKQYCTVNTALRLGRQYRMMNEVCTGEHSHQLYALNQQTRRVQYLSDEIRNNHRRIQEMRQELSWRGTAQPQNGQKEYQIRQRMLWLFDQISVLQKQIEIQNRQLSIEKKYQERLLQDLNYR